MITPIITHTPRLLQQAAKQAVSVRLRPDRRANLSRSAFQAKISRLKITRRFETKPLHVLDYERIVESLGGVAKIFTFNSSHDTQVLQKKERPSCNTVAQNTNLPQSRKELRFLVDWFEGTAIAPVTFDDLLELFQVDRSELVEHERGMHGYKKKFTAGDIIFLDDPGTDKANMGCHFILSGNACREFEKKIKGDWIGFAEVLSILGVSFSRTDAAIDDFEGILDMETLRRKVALGELLSRFDTPYEMTQYDIKAARAMNVRIRKKMALGQELTWEEHEFYYRALGIHTGHTLYFGSAKSRMRYRCYDKLQQARALLEYEESREEPNEGKIERLREDLAGATHWIRFEAQMRDERADRFWGTLMARQMSFAEVCTGALLNYIRFVDVNEDDLDNPSRWETSAFWQEFIGKTSRVQLTMGEPIRTYEKSVRNVEDRWSATIATYFQGKDNVQAAFERLMSIGESKQTDKHYAQLDPEHLAKEMQHMREKFLKYKLEWDLKKIIEENRSEDKRADIVHMNLKQTLREAKRIAKYGTAEQKLKYYSAMNYKLLLEERNLTSEE